MDRAEWAEYIRTQNEEDEWVTTHEAWNLSWNKGPFPIKQWDGHRFRIMVGGTVITSDRAKILMIMLEYEDLPKGVQELYFAFPLYNPDEKKQKDFRRLFKTYRRSHPDVNRLVVQSNEAELHRWKRLGFVEDTVLRSQVPGMYSLYLDLCKVK